MRCAQLGAPVAATSSRRREDILHSRYCKLAILQARELPRPHRLFKPFRMGAVRTFTSSTRLANGVTGPGNCASSHARALAAGELEGLRYTASCRAHPAPPQAQRGSAAARWCELAVLEAGRSPGIGVTMRRQPSVESCSGASSRARAELVGVLAAAGPIKGPTTTAASAAQARPLTPSQVSELRELASSRGL